MVTSSVVRIAQKIDIEGMIAYSVVWLLFNQKAHGHTQSQVDFKHTENDTECNINPVIF